MLRLRTLGYLDLQGPDRSDALRDVGLSKPIALLAYLALAEHGGFHRRDSLVALLWPELDQSHARAALRKALHHLRSLAPELFVTRSDDELRLDAAVVWCDARELLQLAPDSPAEAFALYQGEMLPGFHIAEAPEFERWLDETRHKLRTVATDCAMRLVEASRADMRHQDTVRWARRAVEISPLEERPNRLLIEVLDKAGDRPAALAAYDRFVERLRTELEVEPGEETRRYAAALRQVESSASPAAPLPPTSQRRSRRRVIVGALVVVAAIAAGLILFWRRPAAAVLPTRVAIFPFSVQDPELSYLREGLMDLLSHAIDGAGVITTVDPRLLLMRLQAPKDSLGPDLATASRVAHELGAERFVLGRVIPYGDSVQILMSLYQGRNPTGAERQFSRGGPVESTSNLIASLARDLLLTVPTGPGNWVTEANAPSTASYSALRAYARGQADLRRGHFGAAVSAFRAAIGLDSTFALAWVGLSDAEDFNGAHDTAMVAAIDRAWRLADRLSPRDRLAIEMQHAERHGAVDRAEELALRLVSTYPHYAEGWYYLGDVRFWWAWRKGNDPADAKDMFVRVRTLDPAHQRALHKLAWIAGQEGNGPLADSLSRMAWGVPWLLASIPAVIPDVRRVSDTGARQTSDSLRIGSLIDSLSSESLQSILMVSEDVPHYLDRLSEFVRVPLLLTDPTRRPREEQSLGYLLQGYILAAAGQWTLADKAFGRADSAGPGVGYLERGFLASLPFMQVPSERRRAIRNSLSRWIPPHEYLTRSRGREVHAFAKTYLPPPWLVRHARDYVVGLLSAGLGDGSAAARSAAVLRQATEPQDSIGLLRDFSFEIEALSAMTRGDTATTLAYIDSVEMRVATHYQVFDSPYHMRPVARLLRAEALASQGRDDAALGWFAGLQWIGPTAFVLQTHAHRRRGELLERLGNPAEAAQHYRRFVTRWESADALLQPQVRAVRERLSSIEAAQ